mmetsp:Transcript_36236/g.93453  ORF Transcript_36236/g.93453 Transcript_36236/m.93453 type:complete len:241 (+) Transcript_36236:104-826(+)
MTDAALFQHLAPGCLGIVRTDRDRIIWDARCRKEEVNAQLTTKFQMRSAIKLPGIPTPPQRNDTEAGAPLDVAKLGFDPNGQEGKDLRNFINMKLHGGPKDRHAMPSSSSHNIGWAQDRAKVGEPLVRSRSTPTMNPAHSTDYEWMREKLVDVEAKRRRKHEARLAKAEESVQRAMAASGHFLCKGPTGHKWNKSAGETDITAYENEFIIKNCGVTLVQTRPSDVVVLKDKMGNWCPSWK